MSVGFSQAGVTQLVECNLAKVDVAGSNPVSRSITLPTASFRNRTATGRRPRLPPARTIPYQRRCSFGEHLRGRRALFRDVDRLFRAAMAGVAAHHGVAVEGLL